MYACDLCFRRTAEACLIDGNCLTCTQHSVRVLFALQLSLFISQLSQQLLLQHLLLFLADLCLLCLLFLRRANRGRRNVLTTPLSLTPSLTGFVSVERLILLFCADV